MASIMSLFFFFISFFFWKYFWDFTLFDCHCLAGMINFLLFSFNELLTWVWLKTCLQQWNQQPHLPSSASNSFMSAKSALPTPTMISDIGREEALTICSLVSAMSDRTPSVNSSRTKYCCKDIFQKWRLEWLDSTNWLIWSYSWLK